MLPDRQEVTIHLYDILGRRVQTVVDGEREGRQEAALDLSRLASGMYFLRLVTGETVRVEKMTIVK
jgi:hypothetical protein